MEDDMCRRISVSWRGKNYVVEMNKDACLKDLGEELQRLTNARAETMRLFVPAVRGSKLMYPFSDEHSCLSLQETTILEGIPIRMMGVLENEVDEVLQHAKVDHRIAGFDEEEKRLKQRMLDGTHSHPKLPQGNYVFCDFRTLQLPGIELNPPPSEALRLMHTLAADPGIVAIMNKHRWRVGIMTEMAPVGYVGVSPKCLLGFNKNHGEEISLRLRTDDLKGFRKYESIKKTLLHELAHMVHSEHDADFFALNSQLNKEAAALDWTKSTSHTLGGGRNLQRLEGQAPIGKQSSSTNRLGGRGSGLANARASSVAAAQYRFANSFDHLLRAPDDTENDLNNPQSDIKETHKHVDVNRKDEKNTANEECVNAVAVALNPTDWYANRNECRVDRDGTDNGETMESEQHSVSGADGVTAEPDPDEMDISIKDKPIGRVVATVNVGSSGSSDGDTLGSETVGTCGHSLASAEPDPDDCQAKGDMQVKPNRVTMQEVTECGQRDEHDQDVELQRIQDPVTTFCSRLQMAIQKLKSEAHPSEASTVLQTLSKIVRNVIENPDEIKFKRLRKTNPIIRSNIVGHEGAMEILFLIGFSEDVVYDAVGRTETYLVLKRNDPGLLWIAKSFFETGITQS